ncbi:MAG: hypothetical protein WC552_04915 [Candidatus Omnitrophota bacterium]
MRTGKTEEKRKNIPRQNGCGPRGAFTLVEALIVTSLLLMITVVLYHAFFNGVKLWERSQRFAGEEDMAVFFDRLGEELRNSCAYNGLVFTGRKTRLNFPTIVKAMIRRRGETRPSEYIPQPGKVEYYFDPAKGALYRRQANYGQAIKNKFSQARLVIDRVDAFKFRYYLLDKSGSFFQTEFADQIPAVIEIDIQYHDENGRKHGLSRMIYIPIGNGIEGENVLQ